MQRILYELQGAQGQRYSSFSWRTRMALLHKQLDFKTQAVRVSDKAAIAFSGQKNVPILIDGDEVIVDSWRIAEHLEDRYPERPSLFDGATGRSLSAIFNGWADRQLLPALFPYLALDLQTLVDTEDAAHLRVRMERIFGQSLEDLAAQRATRIAVFRELLQPIRRGLQEGAQYLTGHSPLYVDYVLFSLFLWARMVSKAVVLERDDPITSWFERMLDLHTGTARAALEG